MANNVFCKITVTLAFDPSTLTNSPLSPKLFPLNGTLQFDTVQNGFFCVSTVKRVPKGTR